MQPEEAEEAVDGTLPDPVEDSEMNEMDGTLPDPVDSAQIDEVDGMLPDPEEDGEEEAAEDGVEVGDGVGLGWEQRFGDYKQTGVDADELFSTDRRATSASPPRRALQTGHASPIFCAGLRAFHTEHA